MEKALLAIYFFSLGFSTAVCFFFRRRHEFPINSIWIYLGLTFLVDAYSEYLYQIGLKFQYLYIIYGPVEYFFIASVYYYQFKNKLIRKAIPISIIIYAISSIIYGLILKYETHYYIFNLRGALIISLLLIYFNELYKRNEIIDLKNEPIFWISIGNLFFWSGTFFIMGLVTPLNKIDPKIGTLLFSINPILNIFSYNMFIKAILCKRKSIQL
jgi:hypothetical protein